MSDQRRGPYCPTRDVTTSSSSLAHGPFTAICFVRFFFAGPSPVSMPCASIARPSPACGARWLFRRAPLTWGTRGDARRTSYRTAAHSRT
jgi:hypothetical protein